MRPVDGDVNGTSTTDLGAYEWHGNTAPYASAGPDRVVLLGSAVSFDSVGSRDPDGTIASWRWDFADGSPVATTPTASHTYSAAGTYAATLTVTDDLGATGTDTVIVSIVTNLPPQAAAGPDQYVAPGAAVLLDGGGSADPDGAIVAYSWELGDGSPAGTTRTVTHVYPAAGVYLVTLRVTDNMGATATDSAYVVVGGGPANAPPAAEAGPNRSASVGASITLDGTASADSDGSVTAYAWDFGDGASGSGSMVSHAWSAAGSYLVKLTVTDNRGATDEDFTMVVVSDPTSGNAAPSAEAGPNRNATVGTAITLDGSGSSDADGTIASYAWDFGDGSSGAGSSASHAWAAAGNYLVKLAVTDDKGATGEDLTLVVVGDPTSGNAPPRAEAGPNRSAAAGTAITLDGSGSSDADGTIASYAWDFGDGSSGAASSASHAWSVAGSYLVKLTVTDDEGAIGEDFTLVVVSDPQAGNAAPSAEAGPNRNATVGTAITLDGSGSSDADGTIASYAWDFGDGSSGAGSSASHAWAAAGNHLVKLTVTDDKGATAADFALVVVSDPTSGANSAPVAEAGPPRSALVGESVSLNGSASADSDGTIVSWAWDFGDDQAASTQAASHAWTAPGTYLVKLTATDDDGAIGQDYTTVTVRSPEGANEPPVAAGGADLSGTAGQAVAFDASSSTDPDGAIVAYLWDFGDGQSAVGKTASHQYATAGGYTATLTVIDNSGASASDTLGVTIAKGTGGGVGCACGASGGASGVDLSVLVGVLALLRSALRRRARGVAEDIAWAPQA